MPVIQKIASLNPAIQGRFFLEPGGAGCLDDQGRCLGAWVHGCEAKDSVYTAPRRGVKDSVYTKRASMKGHFVSLGTCMGEKIAL